jgi:type I restriction enzyme R subunit
MYIDRRLAGVQAVQTLSRLNRAYPGKDTTYVLDFSDSADEVLKAFSQYYGEAVLEDVTDPNLIYDLRAKLDSAAHYDDFEVERVVRAELKENAKQSELVAAVEPVAKRLITQYAEAKRESLVAAERGDEAAENEGREAMDALELFKRDMATFLRVYAFLSQIFDYGNTDIEKRSIFFRRLLPLLEFGREREAVDLSKVVLTHHRLKSKGKVSFDLGEEKLSPFTEPGGGQVRDEEKVTLDEIIRRVNDLFEGDLTDQDKLTYVNEVIKGKLLESETLRQQAQHNTKTQFENSPDLNRELEDAIIDAFAAHTEMSKQALDSPRVRAGLKRVLLGPGQLWEALRTPEHRS